ncbi:MAG: aromatic ring-hydroxylating dioxygenase subunit alpha [Cyanobacteria bacterium P01_H01_bin.121]
MQVSSTLPALKQRLDVRQAAINPNHWYVAALSREVTVAPLAITLWEQAIVLYRTESGQVHALADRCPHRHVKLSHGVVSGDRLECAYHGWQFDIAGRCAAVPYLAENQRLPNCRIRQYPVQEQDGFVWIFPGEATQAATTPLLGLPEWDHLNYIASVTTIECQAHFSFLIENLMDMYHGHLHQGYQAWASAALEAIEETPAAVHAHYTAQSYYRIDKIWSISQLFFPALRQLHPEPLDVSYDYPHWRSRLGDDFRICCLFAPVSATHTRAYLVHFTSLNAFWRLHKLPVAFRRFVKNSLFNSAQRLLKGLVREDVLMLDEEQQAYDQQTGHRAYELNRTVASVQRLIQHQANQIEESA